MCMFVCVVCVCCVCVCVVCVLVFIFWCILVAAESDNAHARVTNKKRHTIVSKETHSKETHAESDDAHARVTHTNTQV